ncbi:hypothetical protein JW977_00410 [Candidatus Falkowbacteria bacterium]|nr:hypothetical protein [Candidatus Falkowbacteria bacterium]
MKNLWIILGVLGLIFIIVLSLFIWQAKNADFSGISEWFSNLTANLNTENEEDWSIEDEEVGSEDAEDGDEEMDLSEEAEGIEDVGELNFYTLELGRDDADIQSKCTYTFYLPVDITYEVQGVDASSTILLFKQDDREVFQMTNFDYIKPDDQIEEFWPDADEYTTEGGHTNIVELLDYDFEDDMYIFVDTLKIDDVAAF